MSSLERVANGLNVPISVKKIFPDAQLPTIAHRGDAGADLYAYLPDNEIKAAGRSVNAVRLFPGGSAVISTGIVVSIPRDCMGYVQSKSGLAVKGIHVLNSPGLIDSGYRGEIKVILHYSAPPYCEPMYISHGQKIAQLVVVPFIPCFFQEVEELDGTERGEGGLGSTGV